MNKKIDLFSIVKLMLNKIVVILIAIIVCTGAFLGYSKYSYEKSYESAASIYVGYSTILSVGDFYSNQSISITDCMQIMKSYDLSKEVIEDIKTDKKVNEISDKVNLENPANSRIIVIKYRSKDETEATAVVESFKKISLNRLKALYPNEKILTVDEPHTEMIPYSLNLKTAVKKGFIIGFAVSMIYLLIRYHKRYLI